MTDAIKDFDAFTKELQAWKTDLQTDAALQEGIVQGLDFTAFSKRTRCPESLKARYEQLQAQAEAAERNKHDAFLTGFFTDSGSYIPQELKKGR